jgi:hypothetical protein
VSAELTKVERMRLAAQSAPSLRATRRPVRRIKVVDKDGRVVKYIDTDTLAKKVLERAKIEFDTPKRRVCVCAHPACGKTFVSTHHAQKFHSLVCARRSRQAAHRQKEDVKQRERERKRRFRVVNQRKARAKDKRSYRRNLEANRKAARIRSEQARAKQKAMPMPK